VGSQRGRNAAGLTSNVDPLQTFSVSRSPHHPVANRYRSPHLCIANRGRPVGQRPPTALSTE
jgi:hypothetical protein